MILLQPGKPLLANVHAQIPCPTGIRGRNQGPQLDRLLGCIDDLHVADAAVPERVGSDDLRDRLKRTRFPDELNDADWSYGTDLSYLKELCEYWGEKFDWRAQEAELNRFDNFKTEIDGLGIHFIHARSPHADAMPLVVTHGWPGSVVEFLEIIDPLTNPTEHGGDAADAFHVVCPSIPGYGFSDAAREPGMHPRRVSEIVAKLMARLGYERYGAQGGDWGSMISQGLGTVDPEHCAGIHLNMVFAGPPARASPTRPRGSLPRSSRISRTASASRTKRWATSASRARSPRPSASVSTIRRPDSRRGSSRSSAPGAIATATSSPSTRKIGCLRTSHSIG